MRELLPGETVIFPDFDRQASIDAIASGELVRCSDLDHYAPRPGMKAYLPNTEVEWLAELQGSMGSNG